MQKHKVWTAEDIIGLIPDKFLDNLSLETGVDYSVQKLYGKTIFKLFMFAFLDGARISMRILETIFQSERFQHLFQIHPSSIKHSAISMRLNKINYVYFEKIFDFLIHSPKLDAVRFE